MTLGPRKAHESEKRLIHNVAFVSYHCVWI